MDLVHESINSFFFFFVFPDLNLKDHEQENQEGLCSW